MTKSILLATVIAVFATASFAQTASAPAAAASTAKKRLHPLKLRKGAQAASSPLQSQDKKGGA